MAAVVARNEDAGSGHVQVIRASSGWKGVDFRELWDARELLLVFTWRNVLVRYKQTVLGVAWAALQPIFFMVVFTVFFGKLAGIDKETGSTPYPIFAYCGLLPWLFFANSLTQSSLSLVSNQNLIRKTYFPRLVLPISTVLVSLVDFAVAFGVLVVMMIAYGEYPEPVRLLLLPVFLLLALATALGVGLWFSSLNVRYRDVQYLVPFLTQLWLFATPVVYPTTLVDEPWRTLFGLNPMAGVVQGFRWVLLGSGTPPGTMAVLSAGVAILLLASGTLFFRRVERAFADVV